MKQSFQNQVILITGSSQGIGKALAIYLGQRGASIGLNGRDPEKLNNTHEELNALGIENLIIPGDVTIYEDCENMAARLLEKYGKIDCVVANASMMVESTLQDIKPEVFKTAIDSQILGAVFPIKAALQALIDSGAYILLISSLSALYGLPKFASYSMGKASHTNLAQSLRFELINTKVDIGVAYVCFTKNEPGKKMLLPDGNLSTLPKRPGKLQLPREKVARDLARMISRRKKKKILSLYGKAYGIVSRHFPFLLRMLIKRKLLI